MRKKIITFISALVFLFTMTTITGCAHEAKADGNTVQSVSGAQEENAVQDEQVDVVAGNTEENADPLEMTEKVEYSHEDVYLSLTIPDGWDYKIKTVEEMEKYDGTTICAVEFWKEDYPETVFTLPYESFFGICGTGVMIDEFTQRNGINGCRYTEEIEDTLWLTMTFRNPEDVGEEEIHKGTYCIMGSPKLWEWDFIEPEFEAIVESIRSGSLQN